MGGLPVLESEWPKEFCVLVLNWLYGFCMVGGARVLWLRAWGPPVRSCNTMSEIFEATLLTTISVIFCVKLYCGGLPL